MSKVIVTGCCGLLGQKLLKSLKGHEVVGFDLLDECPYSETEFEYRLVDISDESNLESIINYYHPDCIINSAGVTDVDGCEKNKALAFMSNVDGIENLVVICEKNNIRLIQLSTDYVFDGEKGPYSEDDKPNPMGYYGITKLNAEKIIIENLDNYAILRTNVLYGIGIDVRMNFLNWVIDKLQNDKSLSVVTDQYNNPTLAENLADVINELVDSDYHGILNFGGKDYISRYKFAKAISKVFGFNDDLIQPLLSEELNQHAPRPLRGGVKNDKALKLLTTKPSSIKEGLNLVKKQIESRLAKQR
ncbi:MAG: SDR family oxidoreductase [candidate division Zixibacteria bacterium]|nr:SDR family oxidoreductase [candidate division Zixibacteria bacterium]